MTLFREKKLKFHPKNTRLFWLIKKYCIDAVIAVSLFINSSPCGYFNIQFSDFCQKVLQQSSTVQKSIEIIGFLNLIVKSQNSKKCLALIWAK